jgi:hypothetical protein
MPDDPIPADAAHAMQTVTRHEVHPADPVGGHDQSRAARGRFGRDLPGRSADDVQVGHARTTPQADDTPERAQALGYEVDAHAVAAAIIDRLMAGRTLPARADDA